MNKHSRVSTLAKAWFLATATALIMLGCGGGGSGPTQGTGSVAILLTDGPSDYFDEIKLTITEIRLLGNGDQVVLFEGEEVIDLLELEHHSDLFAITDGIPAGEYEKIRLILSDVALIKKDENDNIIEEHHPKLPGNGKLDLNPRGTFTVSVDETTSLQIDIDADKAIHIKQTGNDKYQFRPVVFVDIVDHLQPGKLIRHTGTIYSIEDDSFILCKEVILSSSGNEADDCVKVNTANASLFDNQANPLMPGELVVGDQVIVYGKIAEHTEDDSNTVSALDSHSESRDDDDDDINENEHEEEAEVELTLDAIMVAVGVADDFMKLEGIVTSDFDSTDNKFEMSVNENQGFTADSILTVMLDETTPVITKTGDVLDPANALVQDTPVQTKGVLMQGSDNILKAVLVIAEPLQEDTSVSGPITFIKEDLSSFNVETEAGEVCVDITAETDFYQIIDSDSEQIEASELGLNDRVEVYGEMGDTCMAADDVLIFPPIAAP